jgi:hypothetical protein
VEKEEATAKVAYRVGVSKAIELCCTGSVIDGKEGLVPRLRQ